MRILWGKGLSIVLEGIYCNKIYKGQYGKNMHGGNLQSSKMQWFLHCMSEGSLTTFMQYRTQANKAWREAR